MEPVVASAAMGARLSLFAVPGGREPAGRSWTMAELECLAGHLASAGAAGLESIPLARRLEVWSDVIEALLDPESDERRRLLPALVETSRLSPEGLCEALEVILGGVRAEASRALAAALPEPRPRGLGGVVLAGNIPGLAVQSLLPALLLARPLLIKSSSTEPLFSPAIVAALARREPALGEAFAAVAWPGGETDLARAAFARAEKVIAYGGEESVESLRRILGERLVAHGPKASIAIVAAEADPLLGARKLARDIALFDQRGCLSVQAIWTDGDAGELAGALAWALALERGRLPPGPIEPATAAAVQQLRAEAALRELEVADLPLDAGTVIVETGTDFRPSPGLRTVRLHRVAALAEALPALGAWRGRLQGVALAGAEAWALRESLEELGVSRVAQPGELQLADAGGRDGGIDPLESLA
jgi:hypothetical protein